MSQLVYVHGTNGSGKSTLAREVLQYAGGAIGIFNAHGACKITVTDRGVGLYGRYLNACGGVDGIQPYADFIETMRLHRHRKHLMRFAEGLVTPGVDTCKRMAEYHGNALFLLLDTPETDCIANVLKRRAAAGNSKPYSADNLYKKARSARSWADNLERVGLQVKRVQYKDALFETLEALDLTPF